MVFRACKKGLSIILLLIFHLYGTSQPTLSIQWEKEEMVSKSVPTLQVVVNPPLRKKSAIHDQIFAALKNLGTDYTRYVPWLPYPKLAVAELDPPTTERTSWDFSLIDPMTTDFLESTKDHPVILNFSTIPQWMYKTDKPVAYPKDPDEVSWNYSQGQTLVDSTGLEVANYYSRLFSWYTKGGFTDELGKLHHSGYHYNIPYWEVLNEPDLEHNPSPEQYSRVYDAVVSGIRQIAPETKFVGMALAFESDPSWFAYFLNHKNHLPGIPLDMISYHFYATSTQGQDLDDMQFTYFERADGFLNSVRYIENLRKTLSPDTKTTIDEVGSILHNEEDSIPVLYWNLSGALYAYLYLQLSRIGIDIIGESQLVGYPGQFPSVSMLDWRTGQPNARYQVLKLIKDNFGPGDIFVQTEISSDPATALVAQAFKTNKGNRVLLINKRNTITKIKLSNDLLGAKLWLIEPGTNLGQSVYNIESTTIQLGPFAVAVIKQ
jgi:hypothetical protein